MGRASNTVRVADFAWSTIEPEDGRFQLDLFGRATALAADFGMNVIVATPTTSPPAWLTASHPEVLAVDQNGVRLPHGGRCHYNVASATYDPETRAAFQGWLRAKYATLDELIRIPFVSATSGKAPDVAPTPRTRTFSHSHPLGKVRETRTNFPESV